MVELADKALLRRLAFGGPSEKGARRSTSPIDKPGYIIENLPPEQRELLKTLKADDIKDIRWPPF